MAGVHHLSSILLWRISSFSACNTTLPSPNQTLLYGTGKDALNRWISNMVQLSMGGGVEKWTTAIVTYWIDKGFRDFSNGNHDWSLDGVGKFMDDVLDDHFHPSISKSIGLFFSGDAARVLALGFRAVFLGVSVALMRLGSVTFLIGVPWMPWVVGRILLFYFAGIVTSLSQFGRSILCPASPANHLPG
ncbi:hypothetical protein Acr_02g0014180 [Actinidia rufa]|uniref:Transmembrane protein n=1 Tax=Actinidia rufa TaxID=165716 RepID=A0A7J0E9N2_9ERIC|nr:hypothetical protein Acr_02g0014180 [Actinidia rufa]